jgi:ribosomal protein S18 acetylase RimI-like enzyme
MMEDFNRAEGIAWNPAIMGASLRELLGNAALGQVLLFEETGALLGYAVLTYGYDLEFGGRDGYLTELYLRPEYRGRGLGTWALAQIEQRAREAGVRALHLMVRPQNAPALALYRRAGFSEPPRLFLTKPLRSSETGPT